MVRFQHKAHDWLKDGDNFSKSLPALAEFVVESDISGPYLDAGCGNGELLKLLAKGGCRGLYGVDIEPGHVERARVNIPVAKIWQGSIADPPELAEWEAIDYGFISAIGWLHRDWRHAHAVEIPRSARSDPNTSIRALAAFHRMMKPGGVLAFDWPDPVGIEEFAAAVRIAGFLVFKSIDAGHYPVFLAGVNLATKKD